MARTVIRGLGLALIGTGIGVALARRAAGADESASFVETTRGIPEWYGPVRLTMPLHFRHSHSFASLHTASREAIRGVLPSPDLQPVCLPDGHALAYILAARHMDVTDASDHPDAVLFPTGGEVTVAVVVTREPRDPVRRLAAVAGLGGHPELFALHMPVTHLQGRESGRLGWGMPKFVADIDFEDDTRQQRVRVSEDGAHILTLTVRPGGRTSLARDTVIQYQVLDGRLVRTDMVSHGFMQRRLGGAELELGTEHPVAVDLRRLGISRRALASVYLPAVRVIAGAPVAVGDARPYGGYLGADRAFGRFTVRYPGTGPIDQYAAVHASPA